MLVGSDPLSCLCRVHLQRSQCGRAPESTFVPSSTGSSCFAQRHVFLTMPDSSCMRSTEGMSTLQGDSSHDSGFTSMLPAASLRLPAPVFSQTLPAQIRSPLFGCDCPICTGIALASAFPRAHAAAAADVKAPQVLLPYPCPQTSFAVAIWSKSQAAVGCILSDEPREHTLSASLQLSRRSSC